MTVDKLKTLFEDQDLTPSQVAEVVNDMDHFEVARLLHQLPVEQQVLIFQSFDSDLKKQEVLYETDVESRKSLVQAIGHENLAEFLENMPLDEAADILQEAAPEVQEKILEQMETPEAETIKNLLGYHEETAGGLMSPHFNHVGEDELAGDLLMRFLRNSHTDQGTNFYVLTEKKVLIGFFSLRNLLNAPPKARAADIMRENLPKVYLDDLVEKVANVMDHEHLSTIPVVDDNEIIQGIITFDDVLRGLKNMASEDIYAMVGTGKVDSFALKTRSKIRARVPWLLTTFFGGLVSAYILKSFEFTLTEFTTVLLFIPFVLGLAGNVGIQGATVIVRGMATGDIQSDNLSAVIRSEFVVGTTNGLIFGVACGLFILGMSYLFPGWHPMLGLSVGLGIVLAVMVAALIGSLTPWVFMELNIDPAISTGPVVTVINDIAGLTIYLATTTLLFGIL